MRCTKVSKELGERLKAYVIEQSFVQWALKEKFMKTWRLSLTDERYQEKDEDDHRLRMKLGMTIGCNEDEQLGQEKQEVEDKDEGDETGAGDLEVEMGEDWKAEDMGWV
ncbi:hypothetical protein GYMLUDRAFT_61449 [Collybiopsis luxurians FD-317 M1]|uniref:Uncharacterized protein n=1 Tax=Collybiopsis luxurians FD-317 M1 TaxID=944289 RepID=A0A0D0CQ12_9AGAR|nr:hypothetical protein GYMLUDRAFT_61449 [Collybiopsis luxurians FD-317 M1]